MKRVIYIAFVAVGLMAVSCGKEKIQPNADGTSEVPVWRATSDDSTDGAIVDDGSITDPNNDRDENSRRRNN
jgi:hypothetical protein